MLLGKVTSNVSQSSSSKLCRAFIKVKLKVALNEKQKKMDQNMSDGTKGISQFATRGLSRFGSNFA